MDSNEFYSNIVKRIRPNNWFNPIQIRSDPSINARQRCTTWNAKRHNTDNRSDCWRWERLQRTTGIPLTCIISGIWIVCTQLVITDTIAKTRVVYIPIVLRKSCIASFQWHPCYVCLQQVLWSHSAFWNTKKKTNNLELSLSLSLRSTVSLVE